MKINILEDGLTAYVSSNYLSTSKPTQKSSNSGGSAGKSSGGRIIEEDGGGTYGGTILTDPSVLKEGLDPNRDPWDTVYRPVYGGAGGGSTSSTTPSVSVDSDSSQSSDSLATTVDPAGPPATREEITNPQSLEPGWDPWDTEYKAVYGGSGG